MKLTTEMSIHLAALFDYGFLIKIDATPYLDSEVRAIYPDDEQNDEWVYSSEVFDKRKLSEVNVQDIQVFKPATDMWKFNELSLPVETIDNFNSFVEDINHLKTQEDPDYRPFGLVKEFFKEDE